MYIIERTHWRKDDPVWEKVIPLLQEVLGYTKDEAQLFQEVIDIGYAPPFAIDVTKEQVGKILKPFWDYHINVYCAYYNDETLKCEDIFMGTQKSTFGFETDPYPKSHYYDEPVITAEQRVDAKNPPTFHETWTCGLISTTLTTDKAPMSSPKPSKPIVICPYCKSENTTKISSFEKATNIFMFGIFGQKRKHQWHCNNCQSNF